LQLKYDVVPDDIINRKVYANNFCKTSNCAKRIEIDVVTLD